MKNILSAKGIGKIFQAFEIDTIRDIAVMTTVLSGLFFFYISFVVVRLSSFSA